ncbi:hypothetical protein NQ318_017511 [Aromia moschata]|uniref:Transposase n=1 Tax=Aromia moschata TaxID=1265417 RepID=A0AAV8Z032_9CUCU|nr:hypothetical protein NQ318_017511 [Aromia moschata]
MHPVRGDGRRAGPLMGSDEQEIVLLIYVIVDVMQNKLNSSNISSLVKHGLKRNGSRINGNWLYPMRAAYEESREVLPDADVHLDHFSRSVKRFLNLYRQTGGANLVTDNLRTSISHLSHQTNLPYTTCQRILKDDLELHPYRLQSTQEILRADKPLRLQFCQWFINHLTKSCVRKSFCFTDEAGFHLSTYVNS